MKYGYFTVALLTASFAFSCSNDNLNEEPQEPQVPNQEETQPQEEVFVDDLSLCLDAYEATGKLTLTDKELAVVQREANGFSWQLLKTLAENEDGAKILNSPISASVALSMLAIGAVDETRAEIMDALGYGGCDIYDVCSASQKLMHELPLLCPDTKVAMANSMWTLPDFPVREQYVKELETYYNAQSFDILDSFVSDVNAWCSEKTNGLISDLLSEGEEPSEMMLINATYFKGMWTEKTEFNPEFTREGDFYNADGSISAVELMNQFMPMLYCETEDGTQVCQKTFGKNGEYGLYVMLPANGVSVEKCVSNLADGQWQSIVKSIYPKNDLLELVALTLPKFKAKESCELKEVMQMLGMNRAFGGAAQFQRISHFDTYISRIRQVNSFEVNEDGATAAGVTGTTIIMAEDEPGSEPRYKTMIVDRPFIYAIAEKTTGAILFTGLVRSF